MKISLIKWNKTKKILPNKSGEYLCLMEKKYFTVLCFSQKYNMFNVYDYDDNDIIKINNLTNQVKYWIEINKL